MAAVHGVATFSGLTLDQAADGYSRSVAADGLAAATTDSFSVTARTSDASCRFRGLIAIPLSGSPFSLDVLAEDPYGNVDAGFNGSLMLALANNPGGADAGRDACCAGGERRRLVLRPDAQQAGSGFTLQAASSGLASGTSSPFDVTKDELVVTTRCRARWPPEPASASRSVRRTTIWERGCIVCRQRDGRSECGRWKLGGNG